MNRFVSTGVRSALRLQHRANPNLFMLSSVNAIQVCSFSKHGSPKRPKNLSNRNMNVKKEK